MCSFVYFLIYLPTGGGTFFLYKSNQVLTYFSIISEKIVYKTDLTRNCIDYGLNGTELTDCKVTEFVLTFYSFKKL